MRGRRYQTHLIINENVSDGWIDRSQIRHLFPALTEGLHKGYWLGSRGRHLTLSEMSRSHGLREPVKWPPSPNAAYKLLGNTMSLCIVDRLIVHLLHSLYPKLRIRDPWTTQAAQTELTRLAHRDVIDDPLTAQTRLLQLLLHPPTLTTSSPTAP